MLISSLYVSLNMYEGALCRFSFSFNHQLHATYPDHGNTHTPVSIHCANPDLDQSAGARRMSSRHGCPSERMREPRAGLVPEASGFVCNLSFSLGLEFIEGVSADEGRGRRIPRSFSWLDQTATDRYRQAKKKAMPLLVVM